MELRFVVVGQEDNGFDLVGFKVEREKALSECFHLKCQKAIKHNPHPSTVGMQNTAIDTCVTAVEPRRRAAKL
ncbi:hypothetical protein VNO77_24427 [Canavalia gladiata]|uniref:Uncharacterized protein n=1 Tax=Canavalia gladiata TaxID=3824 RepID=A0AAN9L6S1_CANGL